MADDERLREALLELQVLRDREVRRLKDTQSLLACFQAYSEAADPDAALSSIFRSLRTTIASDTSVILERQDTGDVRVVAADDTRLIGQTLEAPIDLFARPRNLADLAQVGTWSGDVDLAGYTGLMTCPAPAGFAVLCLRKSSASFRRPDLELLQRLAGLAIQAHRNAQTAAEKNLLAAAIAGSSSGIAIADAERPDLPLVYVNRAFETLSGFTSAEVLGQNCRFLAADAPDAPERQRLREAVAARTSGTFLLRNKRKSGEQFWNELSLFPVFSQSGAIKNLVATQTDVSPRIEAAQSLERTRARMDQALAATEDSFLVLEADGTIAASNHAINTHFFAPALEWRVGSSFSENWHSYLRSVEDFPGRITRLLRQSNLDRLAEVPGGQELDLPDGRSVLVRAARLDDGGLVVSATDVTPMKSAQRLLAQRLAAIEAAPDGIAVSDDDGRLLYLNTAAAKLMGFQTATTALGRVWWHQYRNRIELSHLSPFDATLAQLDDGAGSQHELTSSPLEKGGFVIVIRNVTEKLRAAAREEELHQHLNRLQRQEAIAQITAGVAHDFNNYLAAINGSAMLINQEVYLPEEVRGHVRRIAKAGAQSAKLITRLLDIGASIDEASSFDLGTALGDLPQMLPPLIKPSITVRVEESEANLSLVGDQDALIQVMLNLLLNSADAIGPDSGLITVTAAPHIADDLAPPDIGLLRTGAAYACIEVTDTGRGMNPETLQKVFEPYFTTKGRQGNGLGMAMVAAQLKAVGGGIGITSTEGTGTSVQLYWPVAQSRPSADTATGGQPADLSGMTIIVVDDDTLVGEVTARYLETRGAEASHCTNPRDALELIEEDPGALSALVTDYDMPDLNGGELVEELRRIAPKLPIIVMTALARRLNDPRLVNEQVSAILAKPLDMGALGAALKSAQKARQGNT